MRSAPQDPQRIRDLKAGLDQGGVGRTWKEVAAVVGVSAAHARRVGVGKRARKPPLLWTDPRIYVPQFAERMSDQDVAAWNADPRCLCGCGTPCLQEEGNRGKVPRGAYRLFRGAHEKRLPWVRICTISESRELNRRRLISEARREHHVASGIIADMLKEWQILHGHPGYEKVAQAARLSPNLVRKVLIGQHPRIQRTTAGKLLAFMDEPMPPEIFRAYRTWAKEAGVAYQHIVVIK